MKFRPLSPVVFILLLTLLSISCKQRTVLSRRSNISVGTSWGQGDYEEIQDKYASGFVLDRESGRAVMDPSNARRSPLLNATDVGGREFRTGRSTDTFLPGRERAPDRSHKFLGKLTQLNPGQFLTGVRGEAHEADQVFPESLHNTRAVGRPYPVMEWLGENDEVRTSSARENRKGFHLFGEGIAVEESLTPRVDATVSGSQVRDDDRRAHRKANIDLSVDEVRRILSPAAEQ